MERACFSSAQDVARHTMSGGPVALFLPHERTEGFFFMASERRLYGIMTVRSAAHRETAPASGEDNGLVVSSMRGLSYYDPQWDELLD